MALLDELDRIKAEEPLTIKKGDKKIPLSEVPIGTSIKIGVLKNGKWENRTLPLTERLLEIFKVSKNEGDIFSLEWKK